MLLWTALAAGAACALVYAPPSTGRWLIALLLCQRMANSSSRPHIVIEICRFPPLKFSIIPKPIGVLQILAAQGLVVVSGALHPPLVRDLASKHQASC